MGLLSRRTPFRSLKDWEEEIEDLWSDFGRLPRRIRRGDFESLRAWAPRVDVYRENDTLVVECEAPEMKKEDLDISIEGRQLTIRGRREEKETEEKRDYYRSERRRESFERSFTLPTDVDTGDVDAEYRDGVLTVRLAVTEISTTKQVEIK